MGGSEVSGVPVFTTHGTVLYVDPATGELRHGSPAISPPNARIVSDGARPQIVHLLAKTFQPITCLADHSWSTSKADGAGTPATPTLFEMVQFDRGRVGLKAQGTFLCAERDGRVTLSRKECREWERFILPTTLGTAPQGGPLNQLGAVTIGGASPKSVTVSVLITVFNCERYINAAVCSALAQDFDDYEVIVVDDGSTDGTNDVLRSVADKRLKLLEPGRLGRPAALNFGIMNSHGKYIAILDADDMSLPSRLPAQVAFLRENPGYAVVGSRYRTCIDENGKPIQREDILPTSFAEILSYFKRHINVLFHSSVTFDREMIQGIGGYDTSLACYEDFDLYVRAAQRYPIANIDERLTLKRIHERRFFGGRDGMHGRQQARVAWNTVCDRIAQLPPTDWRDH